MADAVVVVAGHGRCCSCAGYGATMAAGVGVFTAVCRCVAPVVAGVTGCVAGVTAVAGGGVLFVAGMLGFVACVTVVVAVVAG